MRPFWVFVRIAVFVMTLVRDKLFGYVAPERFPSFSIKTLHDHLIGGVWELDTEHPLRLILRLRKGRIDFKGISCGQDKDFVSPHNRAGCAVAFEGDFPEQILFLAPAQRRVGSSGNAVVLRPAKLVPVAGERLGVRISEDHEKSEEDESWSIHVVTISPLKLGDFRKISNKFSVETLRNH